MKRSIEWYCICDSATSLKACYWGVSLCGLNCQHINCHAILSGEFEFFYNLCINLGLYKTVVTCSTPELNFPVMCSLACLVFINLRLITFVNSHLLMHDRCIESSGSTNVYCMHALYPCTNELAIEKHAQQITSMQEVLIKSGNNLQRKLHNEWHQKVNYLQSSAPLVLHTNCSDPLSKMILLSIFSFYGYILWLQTTYRNWEQSLSPMLARTTACW